MTWLVVGSSIGILLALDVALHLIYVWVVVPIFERKPPFFVEPAVPDPQAERIELTTSHGLALRGSLFQHEENDSRGLILFCPELDGNHWMAMSYCQGLYNAGFDILSFDFRSQGDSDQMPEYKPLHWLTDYEVSDVMAVISYIKRRDDLRNLPLGLLGISRGGGAALAAAAKSDDVRLVACEGAFTTESLLSHYVLRWALVYMPAYLMKIVPLWHFELTNWMVRHVSQIRRGCRYAHLERWLPRLRNKNVLIIAGQRDTYVHPEIAEQLVRRIGGNRCELWIVDGAKHNLARQVEEQEYDRRLIDFFSQLSPEAPPMEIRQSETVTRG